MTRLASAALPIGTPVQVRYGLLSGAGKVLAQLLVAQLLHVDTWTVRAVWPDGRVDLDGHGQIGGLHMVRVPVGWVRAVTGGAP